MFGATEESPRMFESDVVDFFSRVPWFAVPAIYLPAIVGWTTWGIVEHGVAARAVETDEDVLVGRAERARGASASEVRSECLVGPMPKAFCDGLGQLSGVVREHADLQGKNGPAYNLVLPTRRGNS